MATETAKARLDYEVTGLNQLSQVGNVITGINQGLELMRTALAGATTAAGAFISTGSQFEQYETQFETLLKTADAAQTRMEELFSFATATPFDLPEVVEAAQKLEAYGVYSEDALRKVGDAAAAMGKTLEQGVEAIADASRGELERLKEFGISNAEIAQRMGHAINRSTIEGLEEISTTVLDIMAERYGGGMEALSQTLQGTMSNLRGRWVEFKKAVADSGMFERVKDIMEAILGTVNDLFGSGVVEQAGQLVGDAISTALLNATIVMAYAAKGIFELVDKVSGFYAALPDWTKGTGWMGSAASGIGSYFGSFTTSPAEEAAKDAAMRGLPPPPDYNVPLPPGYGATDAQLVAREVVSRLDALIATFEIMKRIPSAPGDLAPPDTGGVPFPVDYFAAPLHLTSGGIAEGPLGAGEGPRSFGDFYASQMEQAKDAGDTFRQYEEGAWAAFSGKIGTGLSSMSKHWGAYYRHISKVSQNWKKIEDINMKDMAKATRNAAREGLAAWLDVKGTQWAMEAGEAVAMAFKYPYAAATYLMSAGKYMALATGAGVASGMTRGGMEDYGESPGGLDYDSGEMDTNSSAASGYTASRSAGISTQNLTINMHIHHEGAVVYGEGGMPSFWDDLMPYVQDSLTTGALTA